MSVCVCVCARARARVCDVLCVYVLACAYTRARVCVWGGGGGGREGGRGRSVGEIVNFDYVLIQVLCFVMDYELQSPDIAHKKHITIALVPQPTHQPSPQKPRASKKHRRYLAPAASLPVSVTVARAAD